MTLHYRVVEDGASLRSLLHNKLKLSKKILPTLKRDKSILLNGSVVYLDKEVVRNDEITVTLPEENFQNIHTEDLKLKILYEDNELFAVEKPALLATHPSKRHKYGTLANGIAHLFHQRRIPANIHIINRLDRGTSGIVLCAKHRYIHNLLSHSKASEITKSYIAIVEGSITQKTGTVDQPIARVSDDSIRRHVASHGQRAVTHYKELACYNKCSLLELKLETGRTHQIRVHLAHIGHPLIGDSLYSHLTSSKIARHALHCTSLALINPVTQKKIVIHSAMPEDMRSLLN